MTYDPIKIAKQACPIEGGAFAAKDMIPVGQLRPAVAERVRKDHPQLADEAHISRTAADRYRMLYVEDLLRQERGEISVLEQDVARSLAEGAVISANIEALRSKLLSS